MKRLRECAALVAVIALSACASGARNIDAALSACSANPNGHAEVYIPDATVIRVLGERAGRSGEHEGFLIAIARRTANGALTQGVDVEYRVEDNVNITGPIPLRPGDAVSLLGQLECDDHVIHWTHHDPSAHHSSGYVKVNGRLYE